MLIYILSFVIVTIFFITGGLYILSIVNQVVYKVPQVGTFNSDIPLLKKVFSKYIVAGTKVADLGSGTGKILRILDADFGVKAIGYEIDASNILISRLLNKIYSSKTEVIKQNYLDADLKDFDVIYIYLFPCLMKRVEDQLFSHCKKGTIIIVNSFPFKSNVPIEVFSQKGREKVFIYKV